MLRDIDRICSLAYLETLNSIFGLVKASMRYFRTYISDLLPFHILSRRVLQIVRSSFPMSFTAPQKRRYPFAPPQNSRDAKRVKLSQARTILAQTSEKALKKNGDLDVSAFVKAREFEIKAMGASMGSSKTALSTRAFQQVPKDLRRRTASHNVKKVPKRLRAKAAREVREQADHMRGSGRVNG